MVVYLNQKFGRKIDFCNVLVSILQILREVSSSKKTLESS